MNNNYRRRDIEASMKSRGVKRVDPLLWAAAEVPEYISAIGGSH